MKVLNHKCVVDPVKGLGEVDQGHDNSMRFMLVYSSMDEVEESDEVVRDIYRDIYRMSTNVFTLAMNRPYKAKVHYIFEIKF